MCGGDDKHLGFVGHELDSVVDSVGQTRMALC